VRVSDIVVGALFAAYGEKKEAFVTFADRTTDRISFIRQLYIGRHIITCTKVFGLLYAEFGATNIYLAHIIIYYYTVYCFEAREDFALKISSIVKNAMIWTTVQHNKTIKTVKYYEVSKFVGEFLYDIYLENDLLRTEIDIVYATGGYAATRPSTSIIYCVMTIYCV